MKTVQVFVRTPAGSILSGNQQIEDKFRWPRRPDLIVTLTIEELHWLLDGIDLDAMVRRPVRQYQLAG